MKTYLITLLASMITVSSFAQTSKKVEKAWAKFDGGDQEKGIEMMRKIVASENTSDNWDNLVEMEVTHYGDAASQDATLENALMQALMQVDTTLNFTLKTQKDFLFEEMMNTCREATLKSESGYGAIVLRNYKVDSDMDTAVSKDAAAALNEGEVFFRKGDYKSAIAKYRKALSLQPGYYQATLFIGDGYYGLQRYDSAIHYFEKCIVMNPNSVEPRKYLVDALAGDKQFDRATNECITGLCFYPDPSMFIKLNDLYEINGKKINRHWFARFNNINSCNITSTEPDDKVWKAYVKAKADVESYCTNGILADNPVTKQKYLEVYCWEKMLSNYTGSDPNFLFAKKVQADGYLDCYVLFSLFHFDLYDQYLDFASANRERILYYIEHYLVE